MWGVANAVVRGIRRTIFDAKYGCAFKGEDFDVSFRCDNHRGFRFGRRCYIGPGCHFDALGEIQFADFVIVGPHVRIWSYNHDFLSEIVPYGPDNLKRPVRIGRGCWIGLQSLILPGSELGEGTIVAAGSIVHGVIPPFSMVRPAYSQFAPLTIRKNPDRFYRDRP